MKYKDKANGLNNVTDLLGRYSLNKMEQIIFNMYWNNTDCVFRKDTTGKLSAHRINSLPEVIK